MAPHPGKFTNLHHTMQHDTLDFAVKASPPAGVAGITFLGVSLPDWVLILTLVYTVLALFALVRDKYLKPWRDKRERSK